MKFVGLPLAAVLLQLALSVVAHGDGDHDTMDMAGMKNSSAHAPAAVLEVYNLPSYAGLESHSSSMLAHIVLMVLAWFFVLPVGIMFSISPSRLALPLQFLFLILNGLGVVFGTIFNVRTPDLYENNAHHKIGWIATWVMTAQVVMGLIFLYSGRSKSFASAADEREAFLPISVEAMAQHHRIQDLQGYTDHRWSGDSGHGTERASSSLQSRDMSPTDPTRQNEYRRYTKLEAEPEDENDDDQDDLDAPRGHALFRNTFLDKYLSQRIPSLVSKRLLYVLEAVYGTIDRVILILGFIAITSGGVTYAGIFRGDNIFNGLAHFVKGGIFFWYGLLTLGRWMGCFADFGWAWNVKPSRTEVGQWKASLPSAEFVESFVIWLYGCTNVFLEHLAAWGDVWTAQDLEHVSISIMFFGGGLCGMLIESKKVRQLLNTSIDVLPARTDMHSMEAQQLRAPPKTYSTSLNPLPGLIILLLGVMMSSHHQDSMVSTMVHKQWGTLLVGFSLARGVTYILFFISPPTSVFASRPPSELVSAFCLISGGLIFMASTKDFIHLMEVNDLNAMFVFTVCMGFTAFLMAWEISVLAFKGWAVRRQLPAASSTTHRY